MNSPMISVVMPVYNGEKYLNEAIDSILGQTYTDFEFIILNDGSTDGTDEIILSYSDPRIVYVKNEKNLQIVKTLNKGIGLARGKYIARMDADDISLPERFVKQIEILEKSSNISVVFALVQPINTNGEFLQKWRDDIDCIDSSRFSSFLSRINCFAHPSLMIDAEIIKQHLYNIYSKHSEDYNLWLRLFSEGIGFYKVPEVLVNYRIHNESITQNTQNISASLKNIKAKLLHLLSKIIKLKSLTKFDKLVFYSLLNDILIMFKKVIKNKLRILLIQLGKLYYNFFPKKIDTDILFFFPKYEMGGAEKVHFDIVSVAKYYKTTVVFSRSSSNTYFKNMFDEITDVLDFSKFSNNPIGQYLLAGFLQSAINDSSVKCLFGSNSGLYYDILPYINSNIHKIDLMHAFDGNIEYYSLEGIPFLNTRIVIDSATRQNLFYLYDQQNIQKNYGERIKLITNSVSIPENLNQKPITPFNIVYVGRNAPVKRIYLIGKIAKRCYEEKLNIKFTLIGDVETSVNREDRKYCHFIGKTDELSLYYQDAHCLLITSLREGFPMVVMESMAYGVIPICTDVGGIKTHINNKINGYMITEINENAIIQDFVNAIKYYMNNSYERHKQATNAYEYAKENFSRERFNLRYNTLFSNILRKVHGN